MEQTALTQPLIPDFSETILTRFTEYMSICFKNGVSFSKFEIQQILDNYATKAAGFSVKAGKTLSFAPLIREEMGRKLWENMTTEEQKKEVLEFLIKNFNREQRFIKVKNRIEYLLDRGMDPGNPVKMLYRYVLVKMGAGIVGQNAIRLSVNQTSELTQGKSTYPKTFEERGEK